MPVRKFRSIEEMNAETWRQPGDPELYQAIAFVLHVARGTNPRHFSPGVQRFRSIEDMNRAQDEQLAAHIDALRQRRETQRREQGS